jgi:NADH-ubiquinone oxidoreductase chain 5
MNIPNLTIPFYLKLIALRVTILGFTITIELNNLTYNLKLNFNSNTKSFSTMLGFFPTIIHGIAPNNALILSQKPTSTLLDAT